VLAAAMQDFVDATNPTDGNDWLTLARAAQAVDRARFEDYVAAATADGPLVAESPTARSRCAIAPRSPPPRSRSPPSSRSHGLDDAARRPSGRRRRGSEWATMCAVPAAFKRRRARVAHLLPVDGRSRACASAGAATRGASSYR